jgi:hypothetical protein
MKKYSQMIIFTLIIMALSISAIGQKIMKINEDLKTSCTPFEAKRKGISSVGKYQFGPYKIVSGKAGWTTSESKSKFLSYETKTESKKKSSFVFVANDKDSVLVNTATNTKTSETIMGSLSTLNNSTDNYIALFNQTTDTIVWKMIAVFDSGEKVEENFTAEGILTNGVIEIQIRIIKHWEDGKTPMFKPIIGYEFILDGRSIAAVQSSIDTFQKKFVWLLPGLDEQMKLILAAASAALMVHTDDASASMDN